MPQMRAVMSGTSDEVPAAQESLEQARRLEDLELDVLDPVALQLDEQRAFAFHAGQAVDLDDSWRACESRS